MLQPLSLVTNYGLYRRFKYFHHTDWLALTWLVAARRVSYLRLIPRAVGRFVTLSGSLLIQTHSLIW
jgi:hypothetical protein